MDNKTPPGSKLSGLRTFAKDQERSKIEDSKTTTKIPEASAIKISQVPKPVLAMGAIKEVEPVKKPHHKEKEEEMEKKPVVQETIVVKESPKKFPPPPVIAKKPDKSAQVSIDGDEDFSTTIITDTKKDRFKFFPALFSSIKNWFTKSNENRQAKKIPKYSVPEAARRKGVIQKATSQTGIFATADHSTIQERIRERQKELEEKAKKEHPTTTWTPNTEPGYLLLEEPETNISNVKITPRQGFFTSRQEIVIDDLESLQAKLKKKNSPHWDSDNEEKEFHPTPKPIVLVEPEPEIEVKVTEKEPEIVAEKVKEIIPEPIAEPEPVVISKKEIEPTPVPPKPIVLVEPEPEIEVKVTEKEPEEIIEPVPETVKAKPERERPAKYSSTNKNSFIFNTNTNTLSFSIFAVIAIAFVFGTTSFVWINNQTKKSELVARAVPGLVTPNVSLVFEPNANKNTLLTRITSESIRPDSNLTEFAFTTNQEKNILLKPSTLLSLLEINVDPNFSQAIIDLYFGSLNKTNTFIILRIADTITARGGMLNWEKNIHRDLKSVLNLSLPEVTQTADDSTPHFKDAMLGGADVRVLKNNAGGEEIIYGFVDSNTILITNNSSTFGELQTLIKK